jgi:hypothetical protein
VGVEGLDERAAMKDAQVFGGGESRDGAGRDAGGRNKGELQ